MATSDSRVKLRDDDVTWREVDGEIVLLDQRTWRYLAVTGSGAVLWPAIHEGTTTNALADLLVERFGVSQEQALEDVSAFVATLADRELLDE